MERKGENAEVAVQCALGSMVGLGFGPWKNLEQKVKTPSHILNRPRKVSKTRSRPHTHVHTFAFMQLVSRTEYQGFCHLKIEFEGVLKLFSTTTSKQTGSDAESFSFTSEEDNSLAQSEHLQELNVTV